MKEQEVLAVCENMHHYLSMLSKSRAIQINNEKKLIKQINKLRQSATHAAETGLERSGKPACP